MRPPTRFDVPWQDDAPVTKAKLHLTFPEHLVTEPVIHRVADEQVANAIVWLVEAGLKVDRIEG